MSWTTPDLPSGTVTFLDKAQPLRAHRLAAAAATLRRIIGAGLPPGGESRGECAAIEEASARGHALTLTEAIAVALEGSPLTPSAPRTHPA